MKSAAGKSYGDVVTINLDHVAVIVRRNFEHAKNTIIQFRMANGDYVEASFKTDHEALAWLTSKGC